MVALHLLNALFATMAWDALLQTFVLADQVPRQLTISVCTKAEALCIALFQLGVLQSSPAVALLQSYCRPVSVLPL